MQLTKSALVGMLAVAAFGSETLSTGSSLVVHEWGTFTSVADRNGNEVWWRALEGPADLPCFVHRDPVIHKGFNSSWIRMETPVLYFYSPQRTQASVKVWLPKGRLTEWYPDAARQGMDTTWGPVEIMPGAALPLPESAGSSHYFAARNTDAAPIRVGVETEKMIFYRGIADFSVPVRPRFKDGGERLEIAATEKIPRAFLFENRNGRVGFRAIGGWTGSVVVAPPELTADAAGLRRELVAALEGAGLYRKEAEAMVETWRDSWFEEGMRLLYLVPRSVIDREVPLSIKPAPASIERVFMGRVELLSPEMAGELTQALNSGNAGELRRYGRFAMAFADAIGWTKSFGVSGGQSNGSCVQ